MNKSQLIEAVAEKAQMSRAAAARAVDAIFGTAGGAISEAVQKAGKVSLPGFGKFTRKDRPERKGRNPRTGAVINIPARATVTFHPGKGLKDQFAAAEVKGGDAAKKVKAAAKGAAKGAAKAAGKKK